MQYHLKTKTKAALFILGFIGGLRILLVGEELHQITRRIIRKEVIKGLLFRSRSHPLA